ncbi:MAG: glycosyl hydrolase [Tepidisphaeraceae bacterium]|jgi:hypothetical protein
MSTIKITILTIFPLLASHVLLAQEPTIATLEDQFLKMPMEARRHTGPLFWLHGDETKAQLEGELKNVLDGHNGTFTTEPRPHTDWLGEGWYRDVGICLDFARKNNLTMFIYDDWWWPSQMMGGRVPPQYGSKRLEASVVTIDGPREISEVGYGDANLIAVIAGKEAVGETIDGKTLANLTASVKDGTLRWNVPDGKWKIMKFTWRFNGTKGGQQKYISVDGASPDCVDWFIKTVYQPHYDHFKDDYGKTIVGYFYDEPETQGDWGTDVMKVIAERKFDLNKLLVGYKFKLAGEEQTAAFYSYIDCFAEAWGRTMYGGMSRWCRDHNVVSMGHFMEHENCIFDRNMSGGNMMQLQKFSGMGGIDLVCGQVYPGQRNMGFYQMPKIASSIAHTYNKDNNIAMCEIFGGYNQVLTYAEMKWLADWEQVRGVNHLIPHSFNPRAPYDSDYPPYFYNGGFEPRWPLYRVWADYNNRLSLMLTGGRHIAPVAFLHLGQSYHVGEKIRPEELTSALQDAQFDCDWLLYDAWENDARLEGKQINLHKEDYEVLVVPAAEVIPYPTLAKAREFFDKGGVVVGYGMLPTKSATLGHDSKDIAQLTDAIWGAPTPGLGRCKASAAGGKSYFLPARPTPQDIQKVLTGDAGIHAALEVVAGETNNWLHVLHRQKAGRDVFLVCNQNHQGDARQFKFRLTADGEPECWDPMHNEITAIPTKRIDSRTVEVDLTLEPSESVILVFQPQKRPLAMRLDDSVKPIGQPIAIERQAVAEKPAPQPAASNGPFPLEGCSWVWYPEGNPAVDAPAGSRYFRGDVTIPQDRKIKAARMMISADNEFTLHINGQKAAARTGDAEAWRKPETADITRYLSPGKNQFAILAVNLDQPGVAKNPAGLIGRYTIDFEQGEPLTGSIDTSWKTAKDEQANWTGADFDDNAWVAAKVAAAYGAAPWGKLDARKHMTISPVKADPFEGRCEVPAGVDLAKSRVYLEVDDITPEAAATVTINGAHAGGFIGKPLRLDVTQSLKPGANLIRIDPFAPKTAKLVAYPR